MNIYSHIIETIGTKGAVYLLLIDPDKITRKNFPEFMRICEASGVDGFLVGGSLMINGDLTENIKLIKKHSSLPAIIFPGSVNQVSQYADAIFFLSLISGRNPEDLIGKHVISAPLIKKYDLEAISIGYILVESGSVTTAEYISGSKPIPRSKPEIAAATALAAQYLGMKMIYLEGGSGAKLSVPNEMVKAVSSNCDIPVIVGGGLRDPREVREKINNGAKVIVTGNYFEDESNWPKIKSFADAVHYKIPIEV